MDPEELGDTEVQEVGDAEVQELVDAEVQELGDAEVQELGEHLALSDNGVLNEHMALGCLKKHKTPLYIFSSPFFSPILF